MTQPITLKDTIAYHEAGHAVVSWVLKVRFRQISVDDFEGKVTGGMFFPDHFHPASMSTSDWIRIRNEALILLAGEAAESGYNELRNEENDENLAVHDRRDFAELLKRFGEHECPLIDMSEKALRLKTNKLIEEHWYQIDALAKALMKNGKMSGHQATRIIESIKIMP